jgi:hypothetical protein
VKRPPPARAPVVGATPTRRWLAGPSRFAAVSRNSAWLILAATALLLLASFSALWSSAPPAASSATGHPASSSSDDRRDVLLYETIVASIRHGGQYYSVAAEELRQGNYPLRPFITFRLPTLATAQAHLPPIAVQAGLYLLAAAVALAWFARMRDLLRGWPAKAIALALLAGGMAVFVEVDLWAFHEIWAGLLVALSLARRRPGRWGDAAAIGLIAALVRETAAIYLLIMAALAWRDGDRREALGWGVALFLLAVALGFHAMAVSKVVTPLDTASPGWSGMLGPGFFVNSISASTALMIMPSWLQALLVALALFGWAGVRDPLGARAAWLFVAFALLLALFSRPDTFYWALMVAPTFLIGLVFVPDSIRDLAAAALDRRRLRVQIVSR